MKIGVIGTGSMGKNHVRVLSEISELGGICDFDEEVGKRTAAKFKTTYFPRVEDLLDKVEAVSIVTPTATHYDTAKKALQAGVNVLLEKPATGSVENLIELSELTESSGLVLAIGLIERHNPVVDFAEKCLRKGGFGTLISAHARRVSSFPSRIKDVGVIMDIGIHDIDILRYLVGRPATRVFAISGRSKHPEFEDHSNITIEFEGGIIGAIEINWLTPMKVRTLSLTCSDKFVELDYITQSIQINSSTVKEIDTDDLFHLGVEFHGKRVNLKKEEPLKRELADFIASIEDGRKPLIDGFDAAETLRIAEASTNSAKERKIIEL